MEGRSIKPTPIYEATAYPVTGKLFGVDKAVVTLHVRPEAVEGLLTENPGQHQYLVMAGKVLLLPGVLRGNN